MMDGLFEAHLNRPIEHHHTANRVVVTVGGGITPEELTEVESNHHFDAFIASVDWVARAAQAGLPHETIIAIAKLPVDIADGIADGVRKELDAGSGVTVFDAGRLSDIESQYNTKIAVEVLSQLGIDSFPAIRK